MGECIEHRCRWFVQVLGAHPQTGDALDRWGCAVEFLPLLLLENTKYAREQVGHLSSGNELNKQAMRSAALNGPTPELLRLVGVASE
jgi:hypothetical protein